MTDAAGELRRADGGRGARARRGRRSTRRACSAAASPTRTPCRSRTAPGERIEPLISLQWFMRMDELARAGDRRPSRDGRVRIHPRVAARPLPRLARGHPALVHLAASSGGATSCPSGTAATRPTSGRTPPEGDGWERDPDVLDTWFSSRAVAVRDARLARRHAGAARLLPDRRPLDGARHPLPVGRPHGDDGPRVHRRGPVRGRLRALGHPGARRPPDEQVAGHGHRPARRDRPRTAPTPCASGCWRCPRPRTSSTARRRSSRARRWRTSSSTPRASCCVQRPRGRRARRRAPPRSRTAGSSRACSARPADAARARSRPSTSPRPRSASTTSSTASCATGTSSSSRTATFDDDLSATLLHRAARDARRSRTRSSRS